MKLSPYEIEKIRQSVLSGNFSMEKQVNNLIESGFDKETAERLIVDVIKDYKKEVFQQTLTNQNNEQVREVSFLVAVMISAIGPVFEITSLAWYLIAIVIAGTAGYFAYKQKPIAGVVGTALLVIFFPITYGVYFSGRTSYIKIELLIPLFMAVIPAFLMLLLISKLCYPNDEA